MQNPYESPKAVSYESPPDLPGLRPTWARFGVLLFLCSLAFILYIDRVCIGKAAKAICAKESLDLTKEQFSWVLNAFTLAYCLFEVPTGHWGDRFGSRGVIARIVIWWSAFTALTGLAFGLWPLIIVRFLFGAGEAGAFPNVARVVTHWFPAAERGIVRGTISTTSLVGGALAPPIAAYLIGVVGWRWTFAIFGAVGVVWAIAFYWWFRDNPAEHPAANAAERAHIGTPAKGSHAHEPIPWGIVLTSPNMWLLGGIQMVSATLFYMLFQWYPLYLEDGLKLSSTKSAWLTSIVIFGGAFGCLLGGVCSDWILRNLEDRKWSRRVCGCGTLLAAATALWCGRFFPEQPLAATFCNAAALFLMQIAIPIWWTVVAEISGKHGASMWGLMNSMGGLGVFTMTFLVGRVVTAREAAGLSKIDCWRPVFDGVAIALTVGAVCWLFVDATRSIVEVGGPRELKGTDAAELPAKASSPHRPHEVEPRA
jgi:MFS transporter, ACS family, glucarate transporter